MSFLGVEASNCFTDKNGKGDVLNGFVLEVSLKVCSLIGLNQFVWLFF